MKTPGSFQRGLTGLLTLVCLTGLTALYPARDAHAADVTLKVGTLFPKASPWGQILTTWAKAVNEKSGGRLELQIFFNGSQGDEAAMVAKMKSGALDGAGVSAVGLGKIYKPILALQMPGLFPSWAKLDSARNALKTEFEAGMTEAGFTHVGWGDVGADRIYSKGFAVRSPQDFRGKKPFTWRDNDISTAFFQMVGGVSAIPLSMPEVLPQLNTGGVNAVVSSASWVEQLQWASKLDTVRTDVVSFAIGAIVFKADKLNALPTDLKAVLMDTGKVATNALTKRIRSEDDAAFGRAKTKMTVVTLSAAEQEAWKTFYAQVRQKLTQGTFSSDLVTRLETLAK